MVDRALVIDDGPSGQQIEVLTVQGSRTTRAVPLVPAPTGGATRAYGVKGEVDASIANDDVTAILALATCKARSSGIFLATVSIRIAAPTPDTPQTHNFSVQTETGTGTVTHTNADTIGPAAPAGAGQGAFVANATAGIVVTAGGGADVTQHVQGGSSFAAATEYTWTWTGVVQRLTGGTETPFAVGSNVLLELLAPGTSVLATSTLNEVCISLVEL
jgi:hypothetical protein